MNDINELVKYSKLFSIYQKLFTEKQIAYFEAYFDYDLSLNEIAKINNVSKNAVYDNLKTVTKKLDDLESHLKILKKHEEIDELINLSEDLTADELREIIKKIGEINGI